MTPQVKRSISVIGLLILLVVTILLSMAVGARPMSFADLKESLPQLVDVLRSGSRGGSNAEVIALLRLPRTIAAIVVGASLGVAGAMVQGHTRNVLADSGILGVGAGASFAITVFVYFFGVPNALSIALIAFIGACLATLTVFMIGAAGRGLNDPLTLILAGAVLAAFLGTASTAMVIMKPQVMESLRFYGVGSAARVTYESLALFIPILLGGLLLAFITGPSLNLLIMGDDVAAGLGVNIRRQRLFGMAIFSLLAGTATALVGPIGFVGLVVPHLARNIVSADYRWILPLSALAGAVLVTAADVIGRIIIRPQEVQVDLVLVFIGVPFFIYVVRRRKSLVKL